MRVHVVADSTDTEGGYVTERLAELGAALELLDRDALPAWSEVGESSLVLLLGSDRSAHDPAERPSVRTESRLVLDALAAGVPVMGICYGSQLIARALGGTSWRADGPELGWQRVDTLDEVLCPSGPWAQMHQDVFAPAPTSRVLGSSWRGPQCFIDDAHGARVIAWQFHPEVTPATYERWVRDDAYRAEGVDPKDLIDQARRNATASRLRARRLVDDALDYLRVTR